MNSVYLVCLIAFLIHVIAVPSFIWAVRRRQIGVKDQEAFQTVESETQGPAKPAAASGRMSLAALDAAQARPYTRTGFVLFYTMFIVMGLAILWSVSVTVIAAAYTPGASVAP